MGFTSRYSICAAATWASLCTFTRFYRVNVAAHHLMAAAAAAAWSTENLYVGEQPRDFSGISNSVVKATSQTTGKNELEGELRMSYEFQMTTRVFCHVEPSSHDKIQLDPTWWSVHRTAVS